METPEGKGVGWEEKINTWGCPTEHVGWDLAVGIPDHDTAARRNTGAPRLVHRRSSRLHIPRHEKAVSETDAKRHTHRHQDSQKVAE